MSDLNLNVEFGPKYEVVMQTTEALTLNVGVGFNTIDQPYSSTGTLDVAITAAETINAYRAVGYDGLRSQPNLNGLSNYAGVSRIATTTGNVVNVVRMGLITEGGWTWTPNQPIFITTDGVLTQSPTIGVIRRIGWAVSSTQINLDPFPVIGV